MSDRWESFEEGSGTPFTTQTITETPYGGYGEAPEVVAEAVKDSRETLAELRFSARASVSAISVDPRLRVSTNHNPRNEDPQHGSLVRTRLCLTVGSHSKRVPVPPSLHRLLQKPPMVWGSTRGGSGSGERQP